MNKKETKEIETKEILEQAKRVYDVAKFCMGEKYKGWYFARVEDPENLDDFDKEAYDYIVPKDTIFSVVNLALCCELCMKGIMQKRKGKIIPKHKLKDLFDELDDVIKDKIIKEMVHVKPFDVKNDYQEREEWFYSWLEGVSNAFPEWRYLYEYKEENRKISVRYLKKFCDVLMSVSENYYLENQKFDTSL